jgi:hypothetical protein
MNTRLILGGKGGRCVRLTTYHLHVLMSRNLGALISWNPVGLFRPVMGQQIRWFPCLKTEAEAASETPCFIKNSDDGQSPKGDFVSDNYFCLPPVNRLHIMPNTRLSHGIWSFRPNTVCCCKKWKNNLYSLLYQKQIQYRKCFYWMLLYEWICPVCGSVSSQILVKNLSQFLSFVLYKIDLRSRLKFSGTSYSLFPPPEYIWSDFVLKWSEMKWVTLKFLGTK